MGSYFAYYLTGFIMIPVFIFATYCQIKVKRAFSTYSQLSNRRRMTGAQAAYEQGYAPLKLRNAVIPMTRIGSFLGVPLALIGMFLYSNTLIYAGLILYSAVAVFQLITLPVEFNASKRALETIESNHFLENEEYMGAKKVLTAAALTYVAALASALATLLRLLLIINRGNRN